MTDELEDPFQANRSNVLRKNVQLLRAFRDDMFATRGTFGLIQLADFKRMRHNQQLTRDNLSWVDVRNVPESRDRLLKTYKEMGGANSCVVVQCLNKCTICRGTVFKTAPSADHFTCCYVECDKSGSYFDSGMFRCPRCPLTTYCSVTCQKADWREHKPYCGK
jgi:hypothetical protein